MGLVGSFSFEHFVLDYFTKETGTWLPNASIYSMYSFLKCAEGESHIFFNGTDLTKTWNQIVAALEMMPLSITSQWNTKLALKFESEIMHHGMKLLNAHNSILIYQLRWPILSNLCFHRFVMLCICLDTPSENTGHWQ